jgi:hypothetical protein
MDKKSIEYVEYILDAFNIDDEYIELSDDSKEESIQ